MTRPLNAWVLAFIVLASCGTASAFAARRPYDSPGFVIIEDTGLFNTAREISGARLSIRGALKLASEIYRDGRANWEETRIMRALVSTDGRITIAIGNSDETIVLQNPDERATRLFVMLTQVTRSAHLDAYWLAGPHQMENIVLMSQASPHSYLNIRAYIARKLLTAWNKSKASGRYGPLCQLLLDVDAMMARIPVREPTNWQKEELYTRGLMRALLLDTMRLFDKLYFVGMDPRPTDYYSWLNDESGMRQCRPDSVLMLDTD